MKLTRHKVITPLMEELLLTIGRAFPSLTFIGGTALAEFHLGHRFSEDLDFAAKSLAAVDRVAGPLESVLNEGGFSVALAIPIRGAVVAHAGRKRGARVKIEISTNPHLDRRMTTVHRGLRIATPKLLMDLKWCALPREEMKDVFDLAALRRAGIHRPWPREIPWAAAALAHAQIRLAEWGCGLPERPGWFRGSAGEWAEAVTAMRIFLETFSGEAAAFLRH